MKFLKFLLNLAFLMGVLSVFSCQKEDVISGQRNTDINTESNVVSKTVYLKDGVEMPNYLFSPEQEEINGSYIAISGIEDGSKKKVKVIVNIFTTREKYINWGYINKRPVELYLEIEEHLASYAKDNGYIAEYELTGVVSQDYLDYESEYFNKMTNGVNSRAVTMLHKDFWGGSSAPMPLTLPVMWPGWNNKVSRYYPLNIWGGMAIYNKAFYRRRMATLWNWGWQSIRFEGPLSYLNDKMSSGINIL